MKRTGFKTPTLQQVQEKQAIKRASTIAKARETSKKAKVDGKVHLNTGKRQNLKPRKKLQSISTLRNKADAQLTPICKKFLPNCECCGQETQVGHHWIEKSRSSFLRYDLRNLVALCNSCHAKIHNRFGNSVVGGYDVAEIIIKKRGIAWKKQLDMEHSTHQPVNKGFYTDNYNRLKLILDGQLEVLYDYYSAKVTKL